MTKKPEPEMTEAAITARLEALRQLYRFGVSLRQAGKALRDPVKQTAP